MNSLELKNVFKTYPEFTLGPINLEIKQGEFFGIFGPPSTGKTSILKLILGLIHPDEGQVIINDQDAKDLGVSERGMSMVFQNPLNSLHPLMKIGKQITEPLKLHLGLAKATPTATALQLMRDVRLPEPELRIHHLPPQLTGVRRHPVSTAL